MRIKELIIATLVSSFTPATANQSGKQLMALAVRADLLVIMNTGTEKVKKYQEESPGLVHGAVYRSAFGEECTARHVNAEGFSVMKGEFQINSGVFNPAKDGYHDDKRTMHQISAYCIGMVIEFWKNVGKDYHRSRNFAVKDLLRDLPSYLLTLH